MQPLSRIGWFCLGLGLVLLLLAYAHYDGFSNAGMALGRMIGTLFWGGIIWAGLLIGIMSILFLSA